jgi:hypothetical protein
MPSIMNKLGYVCITFGSVCLIVLETVRLVEKVLDMKYVFHFSLQQFFKAYHSDK